MLINLVKQENYLWTLFQKDEYHYVNPLYFDDSTDLEKTSCKQSSKTHTKEHREHCTNGIFQIQEAIDYGCSLENFSLNLPLAVRGFFKSIEIISIVSVRENLSSSHLCFYLY